MKKILILFALLLGIHGFTPAQTSSFHDFTVTDIEGNSFDLSQLKGKKVLAVNVASECGLTPQYKDLEDLYQTYKDKDFTVIGFPSNNFGGQEPGTNQEIQNFCSSRYQVTFPMMSKTEVQGDHIAPVYRWLTENSGIGVQDAAVTWNFQKFLIDEHGQWVATLAPQTSPLSSLIVDWIDGTKE